MSDYEKDTEQDAKNNPGIRNSIDLEQDAIYVKREAKSVDDTYSEAFNKYRSAKLIKSERRSSINALSSDSGTNGNNDCHIIAICQDGKFVATFDTANLRIKISKNTDLRPRKNDDHNEPYKFNETVFEINNDFTTCKFFNESNNQEEKIDIDEYGDNNSSNNNGNEEIKLSDRWSIDISNVCSENNNKYFIYIALSNINDEDMKKKETTSTLSYKDIEKTKKSRTAIYRVELQTNVHNGKNKNDFYRIYKISGICKFIEVPKNDETVENASSENNNRSFILRRFLILNFDGIHSFHCKDNFKLYKTFDYPQCIRRELDTEVVPDCMNTLLSCIYDKYFLVEHYKDNLQLLEVYNLAKMKIETITKRVENSQDKLIRKYNRNNFSISKNGQLLCFTRGIQSVKLYFMENGLEAISKKFDGIEKIYLLEFIEEDKKLLVIGTSKDSEREKLKIIIWNMYNNFGDIEQIKELDGFLNKDNLSTRLVRTSGNILQIDDKGEVSSVLENVEKKKLKNTTVSQNKTYSSKEPNEKSADESHIIYYHDQNIDFEPIVTDKEPWVLCKSKRTSYGLYKNVDESEIKTLQLIVGRSTIQVWHQISSDDKNKSKDELPNKGEPFLEYIWTNGIPVDQENEKKLEVAEFKYYVTNDRFEDFYLKVKWSEEEIGINEGNVKKKTVVKEKEIRWRDIIDEVDAVRYACKALEFINKRAEFFVNYHKEHLCEEMVAYINHIIWRFIKYKPDDFRLLDIRRNVMKNLILGDCDHLIKFILFGNNDNDENINNLHIPRNTFWKKKRTIINDTEEYEITNVMELAIHHCKGREIRNTIIVAYLLEYYSRHAIDYAGWMSTVSKALPLLFKYNYDDYIKKLFRKECFVNQNYLSALNIIPEKFQEIRNLGIKFKTFEINLHSNEINNYHMKWEKFKCFLIKLYQQYEDWVSKDVEKQPLALRVVPLPEFTVNRRSSRQDKSKRRILYSLFLFLFIPRQYKINWEEKNKLSPFSRIILYENHDDIYDNPATEAIIGFRWKRAGAFFFFLFLRFLFYVLSIYLFITELIQLKHHWRKYISDIHNFFDIISITFPVIVISIMLKDFRLSDGFNSVETFDSGLITLDSFAIFFLWIEVVNFISPLNTKFVLLKDTNIKTKDTTFNGTVNGQDIEMKTNFDRTDRNDNPYSNFFTALEATYFWLNGDFVQRDAFDYWAVEIFTLIASIFLVTILQNMLITFMSGVYERTETKGRQALLRFRANQIADYEALYHPEFIPPMREPKYIYYIGKSKTFEKWYEDRKDDGPIYKDFEKKSTFAKFVFEEKDYDRFSIWNYKVDSKIEKFKTMKNKLNNNIENLIKNFEDQKNDIDINIEIAKFETVKDDIDKLIKNLKEQK
ncbi:hypothetical protein RclHR1_18460001 [Rhizophagus clarus]|uniref:Ion transport domain-containing protein n=1 Tax=Rhizophagus clarus TaxID=94130 RepID=A0A2Z6RFJ6_9GLOM|nr:hypothetical protein RclHR1_18460001 [Rhizophagus clarus]